MLIGMVGAYIGLTAVIVTALLTGWPLFTGLRRGVVYSKRSGYSRVGDPSSFWFFLVCYAIAFAASFGLLIIFGMDALVG
jgi:hypothetical protein